MYLITKKLSQKFFCRGGTYPVAKRKANTFDLRVAVGSRSDEGMTLALTGLFFNYLHVVDCHFIHSNPKMTGIQLPTQL